MPKGSRYDDVDPPMPSGPQPDIPEIEAQLPPEVREFRRWGRYCAWLKQTEKDIKDARVDADGKLAAALAKLSNPSHVCKEFSAVVVRTDKVALKWFGPRLLEQDAPDEPEEIA